MTESTNPQLPGTADDALFTTLRDVLSGPHVVAENARGSSHEILHYQTGMTSPRARITTHPVHSLNVVGAIARFVWMVGGSDRLEDIAFYEPKVRAYTDNNLTVPGSSYGARLFNSLPGLDQIRGAVGRLQADPETRQAAAVVWTPADAVRESNDIPCTFGLFFHVREGGLIATTVMRSNNAFVLVPYNLFEFSLLAEVVASTAGVPLSEYVHYALSMHVFDEQQAPARRIVETGPSSSLEMPPMPHGDAIGQAASLAQFEARLRHTSTLPELNDLVDMAHQELGDYWSPIFDVLATFVAAKRGYADTAMSLLQGLPEWCRGLTEKTVTKTTGLTPTSPAADSDDLLFPIEDLGGERIKRAGKVAAVLEPDVYLAFEQAVAALEAETGEPVGVARYAAARDYIAQQGLALAAHSDSLSTGSASDRNVYTVEMVRQALAATSG